METLEPSSIQTPAGVDSRESVLKLAQDKLNHVFTNPSLLVQALTHSSYFNERNSDRSVEVRMDNERLEFLGDAVIGLVVARALMDHFPTAAEGKLSRWRSSLVSRKTLAEIAAALGMGEWVFLGRGEQRTGGAEKVSILAGLFEAVIGALYLDAGIDVASLFLFQVFAPWIQTLASMDDGQARKLYDMKTHLQEKTQGLYRSTPVYRLVETWGPEHDKQFRISIEIKGKPVASGVGKSKKEAEQMAAHLALEILGF